MDQMNPEPRIPQHSSAHVLNSIAAGLREAGVGVFSLHFVNKAQNKSAISDEVWTAALEWGDHINLEYEKSAYGQSTESTAMALENLLEKAGWLTKYPVPPGLCACTPIKENPWTENTAES